MNLSPNFTLAEFTASDTASRLGIDNTPGAVTVGRLKTVAAALERVRTLLGHPIIITSGYRSPALNAKVPGSSDTSAHTQGWAADFRCPGFGPPLKVCQAIADSGLQFDQVISEYGSWCHLSVDPRFRGQLLTKRAGHGYETGLIA